MKHFFKIYNNVKKSNNNNNNNTKDNIKTQLTTVTTGVFADIGYARIITHVATFGKHPLTCLLIDIVAYFHIICSI